MREQVILLKARMVSPRVQRSAIIIRFQSVACFESRSPRVPSWVQCPGEVAVETHLFVDCDDANIDYSTALSENWESRVSLEEQRVRSESSSKCFCFFLTFQWRHSAREANQSEIWSCAHIDGTG